MTCSGRVTDGAAEAPMRARVRGGLSWRTVFLRPRPKVDVAFCAHFLARCSTSSGSMSRSDTLSTSNIHGIFPQQRVIGAVVVPSHCRRWRSTTTCVLFPGQGSQRVGMCADLLDVPGVKDMFKMARESLGVDVLDVCLNGPVESLNETLICQPAVVLASLAAMRKLEQNNQGELGQQMTAGFSVGELTALIHSGALSLDEGLKVVSVRAAAMQRASQARPSAMATVRGIVQSRVEDLCAAARATSVLPNSDVLLSISCHLAERCFVVGGDKMAVDYVVEHATDFGATHPVEQLPVSGAFHTDLMQSARDDLKNVLNEVDVKQPRWPVFSNVTSQPYSNPAEIRERLVEQLVKPVLWSESMARLVTDAGPEARWFEVGPGRQLMMMLMWASRSAGRRCKNIPA